MRRSISLFVYLLSQRRRPQKALNAPKDVTDPVVWIAAHDESAVRAFINLSKKLETTGISVQFLVTAPESVIRRFKPQEGIVFSPFPSERPRDCKAFLESWKPILGFWIGDPLYPGLIHVAGRRKIPLALLNADVSTGLSGEGFFHRRAVGRSMRAFGVAFANSYASGGTCIRFGIAEKNVFVTGPLAEGTITLPCNNDDLDKLAACLSKREVWFASDVPDQEIDFVLKAHEALRGTNRRLLLAINPAKGSNSETMAIALASKGWRVSLRSKGDDITDQTQIVFVDRQEELGLWYRIAPITYLGGTLSIDAECRDPMQAAALGSAVVHGPRTAPHRDSFGRMHGMTPPAATQVVNHDSLAQAVSELLSPDVAAAQANAAWDLVSRGAELTDQLIDVIIEAVDADLSSHA